MSSLIFIEGVKEVCLLFGFLSEIEYDGELSATAYVILAVVLFGIIGGLGWCFYRAMVAGGEKAPVQHPDEVGDDGQ